MNWGGANLKEWLFELSRPHKRLISVSADSSFILISLWSSFALRYENALWTPSVELLFTFLVTIFATIIAFIRLGLYRAVIRYISERALMVIVIGVIISSISLVISGFLFRATVPRSVPVIYGALVFILVAGTRFSIRTLINRPRERSKGRVLIVGTGPKALQLCHSLSQGVEYRPMGFVTLDYKKYKTFISGLQVYGVSQLPKISAEEGIQRVFLALEDNNSISRRELIDALEGVNVAVQTVPSMSELMSGQARINDIRDLDVMDLLGRDPVGPHETAAAKTLEDKVVMVSGAGGSIGSELCRQILLYRPSRIVLFDQSEYALYKIDRELRSVNDVESLGVEIVSLLGNINDRHRTKKALDTFKVQTVYHAAAYKHVPLVEHNLIEGVKNNILGTWHLAEAAISANVERFVLISTDKAVRPTNIMGASKRLAELVLQGLAKHQGTTLFSMVRFGNVLGSSGSVVPLFRDQIRDGGPVTVTHPDIVRYFMTIPEASQLVLQAGAMGGRGEVFVLDMGEPVKIADLARKMIRLMGFTEKNADNPEGDIEIVYSGLRPGEKLYEELLIGNNPQGTDHPRIMMAKEASLPWDEVMGMLCDLVNACDHFDCQKIVELITLAPVGYQPMGTIVDSLWSLEKSGADATDKKKRCFKAKKLVELSDFKER